MAPRTNSIVDLASYRRPRHLGSMKRAGAQLSARLFWPVSQQRPDQSVVRRPLALADSLSSQGPNPAETGLCGRTIGLAWTNGAPGATHLI